jgi:hypothetical protein
MLSYAVREHNRGSFLSSLKILLKMCGSDDRKQHLLCSNLRLWGSCVWIVLCKASTC